MNKTTMSLHRVMAEIKSIEEKLMSTQSTQFVKVVQGESRDDTAKAERAQFTNDAKSSLDKITNMITNLGQLKSARNKANAVLEVTVYGTKMTIDEALAQKAALVHKQTLISTIFSQIVAAQNVSTRYNAEIETKVAAQLASMFNNTRKATDDELNVIRGGFERSLKPVILAPEGLRTTLDKMKTDVEEFLKEIDFILSEANATNKVEVALV